MIDFILKEQTHVLFFFRPIRELPNACPWEAVTGVAVCRLSHLDYSDPLGDPEDQLGLDPWIRCWMDLTLTVPNPMASMDQL